MHYAWITTRFGTVIVAVSATGVAAILIANDAEAALRELRSALTDTKLIDDGARANTALAAVRPDR